MVTIYNGKALGHLIDNDIIMMTLSFDHDLSSLQ